MAAESVSVALAALASPSVLDKTDLEKLKEQEKAVAFQRREIRKSIKKERRRERNLHKKLSKIEPSDVLEFLKRKLAAPVANAANTN